MATYKVIQDIEAEDKLLGPLSLRQFLYAVIVVVLGFVAFKLTVVSPYLVIPFLPPMALFGLLAAPFGQDQSSEIWLLAKIRFFLKPRKRIWDQNGLKELVTITAPKKIERVLTNGLSQSEVKSRLHALATTIDSRGWAVKNVNVNMYSQPGYAGQMDSSDRLVNAAYVSQDARNTEITATDDILDEINNPQAQHLDQLISASTQAHHQAVITQMHQSTTTAQTPTASGQWFVNNSTGLPAKMPTDVDEAAFLAAQHEARDQLKESRSHLKNVDPLTTEDNVAPRAAIEQLSRNDDLNISTLARQAKEQTLGEDEVVISLH